MLAASFKSKTIHYNLLTIQTLSQNSTDAAHSTPSIFGRGASNRPYSLIPIAHTSALILHDNVEFGDLPESLLSPVSIWTQFDGNAHKKAD